MVKTKCCTVPNCRNNSLSTPKKLFISVPKDSKRRKEWFRLAKKRPFRSSKSRLHFCEDHFNLPEDMANYVKYLVMGSVQKIAMKPDCLPSKFDCQHVKSNPESEIETQHETLVEQLPTSVVHTNDDDDDDTKYEESRPKQFETSVTDDHYSQRTIRCSEDHFDFENDVSAPSESTEETSQKSEIKEEAEDFNDFDNVSPLPTEPEIMVDVDLNCPSVEDAADPLGMADLSMYCDDNVKPYFTVKTPAKLNLESNRAEYQCKECQKDIVGFRYTCVQCANWDLCGACEARTAHATHYVLRVPSPRPYNEIQAVLAAIRQQLLSENLFLNQEFVDDSLNVEVKEEPPEAPLELYPTGGNSPPSTHKRSTNFCEDNMQTEDKSKDSHKRPCTDPSTDDSVIMITFNEDGPTLTNTLDNSKVSIDDPYDKISSGNPKDALLDYPELEKVTGKTKADNPKHCIETTSDDGSVVIIVENDDLSNHDDFTSSKMISDKSEVAVEKPEETDLDVNFDNFTQSLYNYRDIASEKGKIISTKYPIKIQKRKIFRPTEYLPTSILRSSSHTKIFFDNFLKLAKASKKPVVKIMSKNESNLPKELNS